MRAGTPSALFSTRSFTIVALSRRMLVLTKRYSLFIEIALIYFLKCKRVASIFRLLGILCAACAKAPPNLFMTNESDQAMENVLINAVSKELAVIRSFCQAQFPCDVSSVVAVRMSRAVVSSICRLNTQSTGTQSGVFSAKGSLFLDESLIQLETLCKQFETGLEKYSENDITWKTWTA